MLERLLLLLLLLLVGFVVTSLKMRLSRFSISENRNRVAGMLRTANNQPRREKGIYVERLRATSWKGRHHASGRSLWSWLWLSARRGTTTNVQRETPCYAEKLLCDDPSPTLLIPSWSRIQRLWFSEISNPISVYQHDEFMGNHCLSCLCFSPIDWPHFHPHTILILLFIFNPKFHLRRKLFMM